MKAAALEMLMEEHDRFLKAGVTLLEGAVRLQILQSGLHAFGTVNDAETMERWVMLASVLDDLEEALNEVTDQFTTVMSAGVAISLCCAEDTEGSNAG